MPLYDYQCQQCHRHTEKIQKFSDAPLTECPHCGGHLERVLHAPAVAFKGGGWYADLYSSKKSGGDNKSADAKSGESKSIDSKSDSGSKSSESSSSSSKDSGSSSSTSTSSSTASSAPAASSTSSSGTK